jgi:multisubunit Na+/H+ antiporter MnhC subunit
MLKILEALAALLLHKLTRENLQPKEPGLGLAFLMTKGRLLLIGIFLSTVVAILLSVGIAMSVVGASMIYADAANPLAHALIVTGLITSLVCVALACFGYSKKRFQFDEEPTVQTSQTKELAPELNPKPVQIIEEVIVAVIKDFLKEHKNSKTAAINTPT